MSRARLIMLAAQGAIVAAALAVVFTTLLSPDEEPSLSGVDAPGAPTRLAPNRAEPPDRDAHGEENEAPVGEEELSGPLAFTGPATERRPARAAPPSPAIGPAPPVTPSPSAPDDDLGADDPTDDQYSDTVSRLVAGIGARP